MVYTDAWTGETIEGKGVILATTDGPSDIVSWVTLTAGAGLADQVADLVARVEALELSATDPRDQVPGE